MIKIGPNESSEASGADSRQNVRKLIVANNVIHSKSRHQGHMAANAHMPFKVLWMRRLRVLRRSFRKCREAKQNGDISHNLFINFSNHKTRNQNMLVPYLLHSLYSYLHAFLPIPKVWFSCLFFLLLLLTKVTVAVFLT